MEKYEIYTIPIKKIELKLTKEECGEIYGTITKIIPEKECNGTDRGLKIFYDKEPYLNQFYTDIVETLKKEAKCLNEKLSTIRKNETMNLYISTLKSLRETLELISRYEGKDQLVSHTDINNFGLTIGDTNINLSKEEWKGVNNYLKELKSKSNEGLIDVRDLKIELTLDLDSQEQTEIL